MLLRHWVAPNGFFWFPQGGRLLPNLTLRTYTRKGDLKSQSDSTVSLKSKCQWKLLFKLQFNEGPIKKQPWLCYSQRWATLTAYISGHLQPCQHVGIHPKSRPEKSKSFNSEPETNCQWKLPFKPKFNLVWWG